MYVTDRLHQRPLNAHLAYERQTWASKMREALPEAATATDTVETLTLLDAESVVPPLRGSPCVSMRSHHWCANVLQKTCRAAALQKRQYPVADYT